MPSIISATTSSGLVTSADNSGSLQLATNNGTTAVTIDTSQNVGIGTASPTTKLSITDSGGPIIRLVRTSNRFEVSADNDFMQLNARDASTEIRFLTADTERGRFDSSGNFRFNSGYGSVATAYGCRAWVNFNGQGTVAIRGSGNVSSIADVGTGTYYVNFTNSMPDTNYCVTSTRNWRGVLNPDGWEIGRVYMIGADTATNSPVDSANNFVAIFR